MDTKNLGSLSHSVKPRIIIHGGAGNITPKNLSPEQWQKHHDSLLRILRASNEFLQKPKTTALDAAVFAVQMLEDDPLFNAGKGAVFTRAGKTELEASVMVSTGFKKRGAAVSLLKHVKSPIKLASELLEHGEYVDGGGARGHVHVSGEEAEKFAQDWGLELVDEKYFWTKKRWEEHRRGLGKDISTTDDLLDVEGGLIQDASTWDGNEYLPQGTVGCVVLDSRGTIAVATSTGGLTNKVPGRIGDTPTFGAGFWAEEWVESANNQSSQNSSEDTSLTSTITKNLSNLDVFGLFRDCVPQPVLQQQTSFDEKHSGLKNRHAVGMSGTGNGDSFLRTSACHTAAAVTRFSPQKSLQSAVTFTAGPNGELQRSAGDRFGKTGEGEGGMIAIELVNGQGHVVWDLNCGGMFRAWIDDEGKEKCMVFRGDY